jgi:GTPase SAR1 family protein
MVVKMKPGKLEQCLGEKIQLLMDEISTHYKGNPELLDVLLTSAKCNIAKLKRDGIFVVLVDSLFHVLEGDLKTSLNVFKALAKEKPSSDEFRNAVSSLESCIQTQENERKEKDSIEKEKTVQTDNAPPTSSADSKDLSAILQLKKPLNLLEAPLDKLGIDDDVLKGLPPEIIENTDDKEYLQFNSLSRKLKQYARAVVFIGPQQCGKTWYVNKLIEYINNSSSTPVCHVYIMFGDLQRSIQNIPDDVNAQSVKYGIYAIWAKKLVEKAYHLHYPSENERVQHENRAEFNRLNDYIDVPKKVIDDLKYHANIFSTLPGRDFMALEISVFTILKSAFIKPNLLLTIQVEDFHEYINTRKDAPEIGTAFIKDFWADIDAFAESRYKTLDFSDSGSLRLILTTRQRETRKQIQNRIGSPFVEIAKFPKNDCINFAKKIGIDKIFGEDSNVLLAKAYEYSSGYIWFFTRFLRVSIFIRKNNENLSLEEIIKIVLSHRLFWYWKRPCCETFHDDLKDCIPEENIVPSDGRDNTTFLKNIIEAFKKQLELIKEYKGVMQNPNRRYNETDNSTFLLPLLQLGLIRFDKITRTYVYWNKIIEYHFNPDILEKICVIKKIIDIGSEYEGDNG